MSVQDLSVGAPSPPSTGERILDGVRIIDLTHIAAGPWANSLMGDLGADVVKVEPLEGESFRVIDNIFDRKYASFGTYFETDALEDVDPSPLPDDADPRTNSPSPPRAFSVGMRARW